MGGTSLGEAKYTYSPMVSSCFRGEVNIDFRSLPVKCSTFFNMLIFNISWFSPSFSEPKKTLSEGLRLLDLPWWVSPRLCDLALLGRGNFQSWSSFRWGDGLYIYIYIYNFYIFKMAVLILYIAVHRYATNRCLVNYLTWSLNMVMMSKQGRFGQHLLLFRLRNERNSQVI